MAVWLGCLLWSTIAALLGGYGRDPDDIGLILGFPDWIFWGIVLPWALCLSFSVWFCFWFMADDDLGGTSAGESDHV
jgi:hypothetical protein